MSSFKAPNDILDPVLLRECAMTPETLPYCFICWSLIAERFGWAKKNPQPAETGWGCAPFANL